MLQANEHDGAKTESNACTSPEKATGISGPIVSIEQAGIATHADPDSSGSAPLRDGYDNAVCTDEAAAIVPGTRDSVSETLGKRDPQQKCDSNGRSLVSKQVVGSTIIDPDADDCKASTVREISRECHSDDTHVARDVVVGQHMVEMHIQGCDANGGSVLQKKTNGVRLLTGMSLTGTSEDNNACPAVDALCIDQGAVRLPCVSEDANGGSDRADEEGDYAVQDSLETFQFYFRRRKRSGQDHTAVSPPYSTATPLAGSAATGQNLAAGKKKTADEPDTGIKCYTNRRSSLTALQSLVDAATMTEGHPRNSVPRTGRGQKGTPFPLQSQKKLSAPAKAISQDKNELVHDDPTTSMRKTTSGIAVQQQQRNSRQQGQRSSTIGRSFEALSSSTAQLIESPDWLPKGWTTEVKVRESGHTAGTKDKYYRDPVSGRRFRSKNEVTEYLERGTLERWQAKPKPNSKLSGSQNATTAKVHSRSAPSKHLNQPTTQESLSSNPLSARMKTTPVTAKPTQPSLPAHLDAPGSPRLGSDGLPPPPVTWAPVFGPSGPIWLPWGGSVSQIQETQREEGNAPTTNTGGKAVVAQVSSSSEAGVVAAPSSKDQEQKDAENRGKLIFRLKRKHPEQEPGKGKSKKPMYEVVGRETGSSSTSTQIIQEEKQTVIVPTASSGGQENAATSAATTPVQEEDDSSLLIKEPVLGESLTQEYLSKMPTTEESPFKKSQDYHLSKKLTLMEESLVKKSTEPSIRTAMSRQQRPLLLRSNGEQNAAAWTALGIPATASASGLQRMSQFSANPSSLQQPLETSTQSRWQCCPVPSHSIPVFAPSPAGMTPYPAHMSSSAPLPSPTPAGMPYHAHMSSAPLPAPTPAGMPPYCAHMSSAPLPTPTPAGMPSYCAHMSSAPLPAPTPAGMPSYCAHMSSAPLPTQMPAGMMPYHAHMSSASLPARTPAGMMPYPAHMPSFHPSSTYHSAPLCVSAPIPAALNRRTVPFSSSAYDAVPPSSDSCNRTSAGEWEVTELAAGAAAAAAIADKVYLAPVNRTAVQKPLTRVATVKQLEGLGRRICQQGLFESVQQQPKQNATELFSLDRQCISASFLKGTTDSGIHHQQRRSSGLVVEELRIGIVQSSYV